MSQPPQRPLRIAITDSGGADWTGGVTYRKNLLEALRQHAPETEVYLLTDQAPEVAVESERFKVVPYPPPHSRITALVNRASLRLWGQDLLLRSALKTIPGGVDLTFPGRYRADRRTALVYWIPDFQFLHLPEMYSKGQTAGLETRFRQGIERAELVVLSSQDACEDFCRFAPSHAGKGRVLHFAAHVPEGLYQTDPRTVVRDYHLPEKFFYLPNQFWAHKNHRAVFEALKILKGDGIEPFLVCTGNPVDSRNPLYLAELMQDLARWGLRDQVALLGLVPHGDVYGLIRQAICVVNPSLFEGWSTTVEETKSVGKRILLSDLAVHREQDPPGGRYFDPHDPDDLAAQLAETWGQAESGPDLALEAQARAALPERMRAFAEAFTAIGREAAAIARNQVGRS